MITKNELREAVLYSTIKEPTKWQKRFVVQMFVKSATFTKPKIDFDKNTLEIAFKIAQDHFKNEGNPGSISKISS